MDTAHNLPPIDLSVLKFLQVSLHPWCQACDCALQTLNCMHNENDGCHLGVAPERIMLEFMPAKPWDKATLMDAGSTTALDSGAVVDRHQNA